MLSRSVSAAVVLGFGIFLGWTLAAAQPAPRDATSADSNAESKPAKEEVAAESPLKTLDWLVGDWKGESDDRLIEFSCHFTKNDAFLLRSFRILEKEKDTSLSGMQVIAWDPARESMRSWTFDSRGGFGEDTWTQKGNTYSIRAKYTLSDGGSASAVNVLRFIDEDTFGWRSVNREIDGELHPDVDEITVVRMEEKEVAATQPGAAKPTADKPQDVKEEK